MQLSERTHQIRFIGYARRKYPEIITIISPIAKFAGSTGARMHQGRIHKAMGYIPGTPDIFFPHPRGGYHGLFIELKRTSGGRVEPQQRGMITALISLGYCAVICRGYDEARLMLDQYMISERGIGEEQG